MMKFVIVVALIGVLGALASAGVFMLRRSKDDRGNAQSDARMAWALALRVALSVALFLFILLAWKMGWISPTGLPTGK
ncbi:MAG: DUF2909 domain-containing protein [Pseudomonadota bacterium]